MIFLAKYSLTTPLTKEDILNLNIGDIVHLNGTIYTARDEAHIHILRDLKNGRKIDLSLEGAAIFHCGPIIKKINGGWNVVAAGPTTSSRMNLLEPEFIKRPHVRAIIGKGGMSKSVSDSMTKFGAVYFATTGGTAVLTADRITAVKGVYLEDLGMPEAVWILEVNNFGPLIVGIDAKGNSLFEEIKSRVEKNLPHTLQKLGLQNA